MLARWRIAISASGFLWIRPTGKDLRLVELARLIQRLRPVCRGGFPSEMLFDMHDVHVVGAPRSLVRSLMVHFGRTVGANCNVVG